MDRKLMEAGLRTKKGHGRGSAIMTYVDASMDILAVAATTDEISRAPECVAELRALPFNTDDQPELLQLCAIIGGSPREYKTFGATVDGIMRHAVKTKDGVEEISFEIAIAAGKPLAATVFFEPRARRKTDNVSIEFFGPGALVSLVNSGMSTSRRVSGEALQQVANCIGEPTDRQPTTDWGD
jgi:hypothetical protein